MLATLVCDGIYRSKLPRARDVAEFRRHGIVTLVDLTQRERGVILRACAKFGLVYVKCPMPYDFTEEHVRAAVRSVLAQTRPVVFHCFHGRDRTGAVAEAIVEQFAEAT